VSYTCLGLGDDYDYERSHYDDSSSSGLAYHCLTDLQRFGTSGELMSSVRALADDYDNLSYECRDLLTSTPLYMCQDDIYNLCNGDSLPILEPAEINETINTPSPSTSTSTNLNSGYNNCFDRRSTKALLRQIAPPMRCLASHASELSHMCSREFNKSTTAICASDIARFCSDEKPHKTFQCLLENREELTYECKINIVSYVDSKDSKIGESAYFFGAHRVYKYCAYDNQTNDDYYSGCYGWRIARAVILHVLVIGAVLCCLCKCIRRCRARRCRNAQALPVAVPVAVPVMPVTRELGSMTALPTAPADGSDNYQRIL